MDKVTAFTDENIKSFVCNDKEMCDHLRLVAGYKCAPEYTGKVWAGLKILQFQYLLRETLCAWCTCTSARHFCYELPIIELTPWQKHVA